MAGSASVTLRTLVGGLSFNSVVTKEDELEVVFTRALPSGKAGTLSTRTDADTGILTVLTGHGITASDTVSVFWSGGYRYGVDVTATTATTISIDIGSGADLPAVTTAIVVGKEETHTLAITGNQLSLFVIDCDLRSSVNFRDVSNVSLLAYDLLANEGRMWTAGAGVTNPLAGDVATNVVLANGGITATDFRIGMLASTN